jgi:predicted Zn finger-like uncharacterized protein
MIIDCPDCNKKFVIDQHLIPPNGRLLQCGSCNYKWFFELKINKENFDEEIKSTKNELPVDTETIIQEAEATLKKNVDKEIPKKINKKKVKNNVNYLNVLLVIILSTTAFILVVDTFKEQLSLIFPDINFFFFFLYQSIVDIKLFALDLII